MYDLCTSIYIYIGVNKNILFTMLSVYFIYDVLVVPTKCVISAGEPEHIPLLTKESFVSCQSYFISFDSCDLLYFSNHIDQSLM
jgi:hypothetical protein